MTPREEVLSAGRELPVGVTTYDILCPWCGGGRKRDKSFAITRTAGNVLAYICHRDKCKTDNPSRGYVTFNGIGIEGKVRFTPKPYRYPTQTFDEDHFQYFHRRYGLTEDTIRSLGWVRTEYVTDGMPGWLFPVLSPIGEFRGFMLRTEKHDSKVMQSFRSQDQPWISWYMASTRDFVVVEDQISAAKAYQFGVSAAALIGTGLSQDKMEEIVEVTQGSKIWLALDKDASVTTIDALRRYRSFTNGRLFGLMIRKDIKDMTRDEILSLGGPFAHSARKIHGHTEGIGA